MCAVRWLLHWMCVRLRNSNAFLAPLVYWGLCWNKSDPQTFQYLTYIRDEQLTKFNRTP